MTPSTTAMTKIPKGIKLDESDSLTIIETKNYNETLLLMQIILMFIPLTVINIYILLNGKPQMMVATVGLWLALIYWIIYNIKDNYIFRIGRDTLEVIKGMHKSTILSLELSDIDRVKIKRVYGKVYTHARSATTSETGNTDELIIEIGNDEILVTNSLVYSHQLFIKNKIQERIDSL